VGKCGRSSYMVVSELPGLNTWIGWAKCDCYACMLVVNVFVMHELLWLWL